MAVREKYAHLPPLPADIRQRLACVPELLARHPVQLAYLFGSALEDCDRAGDIDLAVLPDAGYSFPALYADLSLWLGTDRLDLVELPAAPFWLQEAIVRTGRRIYARDPLDAARYEAGILSQSLEHRERLRRYAPDALRDAMGVDRDFLTQVAVNLNRVADELDKHARVSADDLATDLTLCWAVQHGLLVGISLILQAAQHILTRHFGTLPDSYEASLAALRAHKVISATLYRRLRGAGGFRNVLVHEYMEVDLDRVAQYARRAPKTFRDFARELSQWLESVSA
jgi:uncharacterized protein YutE (UPF0331/DUF86 family)/predicted nucleotidyltransferase